MTWLPPKSPPSARLLLLTLWVTGAAAEGPPAGEPPGEAIVRSVVFEGRERIPERVLLDVVDLRPGIPLARDAERRALERLLGYPFVSVESPPEVVQLDDGAVRVVFRIRERDLVGAVRAEGNRAVDSATLLEGLEVRTGRPLLEEAIEQALQGLEERYHRDGFLLATARSRLGPRLNGRRDVTIGIAEGERVAVTEILLEGAAQIPAEVALGALELEPRRLLGLLSAGHLVPEDLDEELERLRRFYVSRGFLSAVVGFGGIDLDPTLTEARVRFLVREGPRYRIAAYRVEGSKLFPARLLEEAADLAVDVPYSEDAVQSALQRLRRWFLEHGDRSAAVEVETEYREDDRVEIVFRVRDEKYLETGVVSIRGNRVTRDRVIRSRIQAIPGERFDPEDLEETLERLNETGYFEKIEIEVEERPDPERPDKVLNDVNVTVAERKRFGRLLEVGGGASSGSGAVGFVGIHRVNFDLFRPPTSWQDLDQAFTGGGQSLDFQLIPGTRESEYSLRFEEPYFFRSDLALRVDGGIRIFDRRRYRESRLGGSVRVAQLLDRDQRLSASLSWVGERVHVDRIEANAPPDVLAAKGRTVLSYPRLSLRYDDLERNFYSGPKGLLASAHVDLAHDALGSELDFVRASASADAFVHLFGRRPDERHMLHLGVQFRWMDGLSGSDVPLFERFYLGGPRSFRGFDYRRLGPHRAGLPVGGEGAVHGTVEYSFPLGWRELRAIALFDWGDLEARLSRISTGRFRTAAGGGLALRLRVLGQEIPANLYWVQALSSERGDREQLFSFTLGLDF